MEIIAAFIVFGIVFGLFDAIWLKSANSFYRAKVGHVMREKPNFVAAVVFYLIYVAGVVGFSLVPGLVDGNFIHTVVAAGALGFVCYATYDLTNLATVKGWSTAIVIVDMLWGTLATAGAAGITYFVVVGMGL